MIFHTLFCFSLREATLKKKNHWRKRRSGEDERKKIHSMEKWRIMYKSKRKKKYRR